jgi:hypothetical protein
VVAGTGLAEEAGAGDGVGVVAEQLIKSKLVSNTIRVNIRLSFFIINPPYFGCLIAMDAVPGINFYHRQDL